MISMGTEENLPPEGWYDDPEGGPGRKRYWDGEQWTDRYEEANTASTDKVARIDREFKALHTIASVFNVLGWLTITLGTLLVIAAAIDAGSSDEVATNVFGERTVSDPGANAAMIAVFGLVGVLLYSLLFWAAAAFTRLWLRMEDNTFRTAAAVERMAKRGD